MNRVEWFLPLAGEERVGGIAGIGVLPLTPLLFTAEA
jgi:hypothetical protein